MSSVRDIIYLPEVKEKLVVIDEAARKNGVKLTNYFGHLIKVLRACMLHFLQVIHGFEGEVEVGQQRHKQELVFDQVYGE